MTRQFSFSILLCCLLSFCVEPQNIELGGDSSWVVFGLIGENSIPVVFIYGVQNVQGKLIYNKNAVVKITDVATEEVTILQPVFNDTTEFYNTNEFPFTRDAQGNIVYYSSDNFKAKTGASYEVDFDLGDESGQANITIPEEASFSEVQVFENDIGKKIVQMSIDVIKPRQYYKWEVSVDQLIQYEAPIIDTILGDTIYELNSVQAKQYFVQRNYVTDEKISDNDNLFNFNMSNNITDYPFVDETYNVNVRLRHYAQEVVDYFESIEEQSNAPLYDPFVEPVFIKSNIDGLIGLIGAFSYSPDLLLQYQP